MESYRPVVLVVLDGWGEWDTKMGNPVVCAKLPTIDHLNANYPKMLLEASGLSVGLPWGVFGNSEVGHQTMGSGQIIYHHLPTITATIQSQQFYRHPALLESVNHAKEHDSALHLICLLSDGGVHAHIDHLYALLELAAREKLDKVYVHALMDGRDTPPQSGRGYLQQLLSAMKRFGVGELATISGRFYAMDRNKNWDRVEKAFRAFTAGVGVIEHDPLQAVERQYRQGKTDEYLEPVVMTRADNTPVGSIRDNDAVIFYNYRPDRARQITHAFTDPAFGEFAAAKRPAGIHYTGFIKYEDGMQANFVFPEQVITTRIGELISQTGKKQLRIAETEKFAHVTYFFNGGVAEPYPGEDRIFVPSKKVDSYATIPEMSAPEVSDKLFTALATGKYDFVLVNYANPDMVGHTGDFRAAVKALETVDKYLKQLIDLVLAQNGCLLITADHGNVEEMVNLEAGTMDTQHSNNPVPCWFVSAKHKFKTPQTDTKAELRGMLADLAPTILNLLGLSTPMGIIGAPLIDKFEIIHSATDMASTGQASAAASAQSGLS